MSEQQYLQAKGFNVGAFYHSLKKAVIHQML